MLKKRIIVCLDVKDGRTTKGVKFQNNVDIGDPVEMAKKYYDQGVDELVFYDIMASARGRGPILELISRVAEQVFIPFCVGGGIGSIEDIRSTILAGAEKVSLNSQAVKNPELISQGARIFGNQCIVLGMDAAKDETCPSGYRVFINGGRNKPYKNDCGKCRCSCNCFWRRRNSRTSGERTKRRKSRCGPHCEHGSQHGLHSRRNKSRSGQNGSSCKNAR